MTTLTNDRKVSPRRHSWLTEAVLLAGIVVFGSYAFIVDGRLASADVLTNITHLGR